MWPNLHGSLNIGDGSPQSKGFSVLIILLGKGYIVGVMLKAVYWNSNQWLILKVIDYNLQVRYASEEI